jgi:hypothetical protein
MSQIQKLEDNIIYELLIKNDLKEDYDFNQV